MLRLDHLVDQQVDVFFAIFDSLSPHIIPSIIKSLFMILMYFQGKRCRKLERKVVRGFR